MQTVKIKCGFMYSGFAGFVYLFINFVKVRIKHLSAVFHPSLNIGTSFLKVSVCEPVLSNFTQA